MKDLVPVDAGYFWPSLHIMRRETHVITPTLRALANPPTLIIDEFKVETNREGDLFILNDS